MNRLAGTWKRAEVMLGSERTEDEVTAELHRLNTRVEHIHQVRDKIAIGLGDALYGGELLSL